MNFLAKCLVGGVACIASFHVNANEFFPGTNWDYVKQNALSPACRRHLDKAKAMLEGTPATSMMAVHRGEVYFSYGDVSHPMIVESVRKSILSMMYGPYVENGTINLDRTLESLGIDDVGGLLPIERQATIRHLLTARSGVYHQASNSGDDAAAAPPRGTKLPGSYFLYNNWDFNAAGTVFEKLTDKDIYDTFQEMLATPLQLQDFRLTGHERDGSSRSQHRPYHFFLSARDLARIGLLMMNDGRWGNQQIIPSTWVRTSTSPVTHSWQMNPPRARLHHMGYGYLWWTFESPDQPEMKGAYLAWGLHGQFLLIAPASKTVIVLQRQIRTSGDWDASRISKNEFIPIVKELFAGQCELNAK